MTKDEALLKALEDIKNNAGNPEKVYQISSAAIKQALAAPTVQEPEDPLTCSMCGAETTDPWHYSTQTSKHEHACDNCWPTVSTPPAAQRQFVGLTLTDRNQLCHDLAVNTHQVRAIEAKLKEKNYG
jgi:hypothetical protein